MISGMRCAALCLAPILVSGCGQNIFQQELGKEKSAVKLAREVRGGGYALTTTAELKALLDEKSDMILIDAMPYEESYKKEHIPGAQPFLFPVPEMEAWEDQKTAGRTKEQFLELLGPDKDRLIVVYCGYVACTRSHNGAFWARKLGYTNVKRYPGGIYAWKGAGYKTESLK